MRCGGFSLATLRTRCLGRFRQDICLQKRLDSCSPGGGVRRKECACTGGAVRPDCDRRPEGESTRTSSADSLTPAPGPFVCGVLRLRAQPIATVTREGSRTAFASLVLRGLRASPRGGIRRAGRAARMTCDARHGASQRTRDVTCFALDRGDVPPALVGTIGRPAAAAAPHLSGMVRPSNAEWADSR